MLSEYTVKFNGKAACLLQVIIKAVITIKAYKTLTETISTDYSLTMRYSKQKGFTLSELLIALSILGVIAAFTIPKVINSSEVAKKRSVFKDSIAIIQSVYWEGVTTQELNVDTNLYEFLKSKLNCIDTATNATVAGMWIGTINGNDNNRAGCKLSTGAILLVDNQGGDLANSGISTLAIDYNGTQLPNENYTINFDESDRLLIRGNPTQQAIVFGGVTIPPGKLVSNPWTQSYYEQIFYNN